MSTQAQEAKMLDVTPQIEKQAEGRWVVRIRGCLAPYVIIGGNRNYQVHGRGKVMIGFKSRKSAVIQIQGEMK